MKWLLDSDVIWKVAAFDLFAELLTVLEAQKNDLYVLPELRFQLTKDRIYEKHERDAIDRVRVFVKGIQQITRTDPPEQIILSRAVATFQNRKERIDGGEQQLFIATKFVDASVIVTHDKKALRTLANDATCQLIYTRTKGRVVCFEQLVLKMIDHFGYPAIRSKIGTKCSTVDDDVMKVCFANGRTDFPEADCRVWLHDYIAKLNASAPGLVHPTGWPR